MFLILAGSTLLSRMLVVRSSVSLSAREVCHCSSTVEHPTRNGVVPGSIPGYGSQAADAQTLPWPPGFDCFPGLVRKRPVR